LTLGPILVMKIIDRD